jgi:large subunit ribosomal protein L25
MEKIVLNASKREITGKKVSNLRREGKLPAVIYGKGIKSTPILLNEHETTLILKGVSVSTIVTVELDGKEYPVLVRDRQFDYILNRIIHLDFQAVSLTEKIRTDVRIALTGDAPVIEEYSALVESGLTAIEVEALPQDLPEEILVDVSILEEIGQAIYVKDIPAIANVEFLTDPEELIAIASSIKEEVIEEEEEEILEEEIEGEMAEPEVIERGKAEEESGDEDQD